LTKDDTVHFLAMLQRENRIQIPIEIRQHFKLQSGKFLRIKIESLCEYCPIKEQFFAKLCTDGRITLPWEIRLKLKAKPRQMMRLYLSPEDLK
jgi:bifunctional DNA-binding transcriptional regulator/antitoxin component of YhaV-PrlF toxin-antitoxin module